MISISVFNIETVISRFKSEIDDHAAFLFAELSDWCNSGNLMPDEMNYIVHLISVIDEIIVAAPTRLLLIKSEFERLISEKVIASKAKKGFRDNLLTKLNYTSLRETFYPDFYFHVGIKACVYCNANLTVSVEKLVLIGKKTTLRAKYQLDHYFAKKENPCLAISLFNLYPVCAYCNLIKGIKKVDFQLYKDTLKHTSPFLFGLQPGSAGKYISTRNTSDIILRFDEPPRKKGYETFGNLFDIVGIYKTQLDVVEELILKAEGYTKKYQRALERSLKIKAGDLSNRLLTGNYVRAEDTHKRPLAKLTRDIAIEIGLLPKNAP